MPSAERNRSIAFWNSGSTAVIHTLNPIRPAEAPPGVGLSDDDTRTYIVGRLPTVTGCPASCFRSISFVTAAPAPSIKVTTERLPEAPRRRGMASRHACSCASRSGVLPVIGSSSDDTVVVPMRWTIHP